MHWKNFKQDGNKIELNWFTIVIHRHIREFHLKEIEEDIQEAGKIWQVWKLGNRMKDFRNTLNRRTWDDTMN